MQDRRQSPRKKTFFGGRVVFNYRQCTLDCVLKNWGPQGAKLVFLRTALLPDEFDLQVSRMKQSFRARVAWRHRDEVGVSFLDDSATANVVPLDHAVRLRKLESDKTRLQARVAQLSSAE